MKQFWKDKKVLVTGAAGFIGSHAVDALIEKGAIVTAALSPNTPKGKIDNLKYIQKKVAIKNVDLLDSNECMRIVKGQQVILNFAALDGGMQFKMKYPAKIFQTNTQIVLNILEAARLQNIERVLLMSSIDIYYPTSYVFLKEDNQFSKKMSDNIEGYAWAKRLAELAAKMYYKQYKLPIAIARTGNVYGPRDYINSERGRVIPTFISEAIKGNDITVFGDGQQEKTFLYVADLIQALLMLTEKYAVADPVNIAGKKRVTIKELAELVIKYTGGSNKIILKTNFIAPAKQTRVYLGKMKRILGFKEKITLAKGLRETIGYYQTQIK